MSDISESAPAVPARRKRLPQVQAEQPAVPAEPVKLARIHTLKSGVKAKGFTFGAKQTVEGVPLAHAEYLKGQGEAEILEVS